MRELFVLVACPNEECGMYDRKQQVPPGVTVSSTVLLVGTFRCAVCGYDMPTVI